MDMDLNTFYDKLMPVLGITREEYLLDTEIPKKICANENAWQRYFTPDDICETVLSKYEYNKEDKILVLFNVEFIRNLFKLIPELKENQVYFIADCLEKYDFMKKFFGNLHVEILDKHDINSLKQKIESFNVKKFDILISNPPYNDNIDLKIIKEIFSCFEIAIIVHPAGFLLEQKEDGELYQYKKEFNKKIKSIYIFDGSCHFKKEGNKKLQFQYPETITVFTNNSEKIDVNDNFLKESYSSDSVFDISIFGNKKNWIIKEFFNKIKEKDSILKHQSIDKQYVFALPRISGNDDTNGKDRTGYSFFGGKFWKIIPQDFSDQEKYSLKTHHVFSFDSENELNNFKHYLATKFVRFCLTRLKISQHLSGGKRDCEIPWMDFTQEWTDKKLKEEFRISDELWEYINKFIPDYYKDYKFD